MADLVHAPKCITIRGASYDEENRCDCGAEESEFYRLRDEEKARADYLAATSISCDPSLVQVDHGSPRGDETVVVFGEQQADGVKITDVVRLTPEESKLLGEIMESDPEVQAMLDPRLSQLKASDLVAGKVTRIGPRMALPRPPTGGLEEKPRLPNYVTKRIDPDPTGARLELETELRRIQEQDVTVETLPDGMGLRIVGLSAEQATDLHKTLENDLGVKIPRTIGGAMGSAVVDLVGRRDPGGVDGEPAFILGTPGGAMRPLPRSIRPPAAALLGPPCVDCGLQESVHADAGGSRGLDGCKGYR